MTPAKNKKVSRQLAAMGYRFAGLSRQTVDGMTIIAAVAVPDNGTDVPPVSTGALTETAAVTALLSAARALAD